MLRFIDGFDHISSAANRTLKYDLSGSSSHVKESTEGRNGGNCVELYLATAGYLQKMLDNQNTWTVGFAFRMKDVLFSGSGPIISFMDSNEAVQCALYATAGGFLEVRRGTSSILGTSSNAMSVNSWYYIEMEVTINDSTGAVEVRRNGVEEIKLTGVDTKYTSLSGANGFRLYGGTSSTRVLIDDLYVCDATGTTNNSFLGDVRVDTLFPTADGANTDFTPLAGSNYENVDEDDPDGDTSYNSSNTATDKDTFPVTALSSMAGDIFGVQVNNTARKDDAGAQNLKGAVKVGATVYTDSAQVLLDSYDDKRSIFEENPGTSAAWDQAGINAAEFGYEVA